MISAKSLVVTSERGLRLGHTLIAHRLRIYLINNHLFVFFYFTLWLILASLYAWTDGSG